MIVFIISTYVFLFIFQLVCVGDVSVDVEPEENEDKVEDMMEE